MTTLIATADIHIRDSAPKCRTDDFVSAQWNKIKCVCDLVKQKKAIWLDAGDLFHKASPSLSLMTKTIEALQGVTIYTVAGNHDLPAHNLNRMKESGIGVLQAAGIVELLDCEPTEFSFGTSRVLHVYGCSYGQDIPEPKYSEDAVINVLMYHEMVYGSKSDILPNAPGYTAKKMLRDCKEYDLIITGHNHQQFQCEIGGRHLVNVGCLTRQAADYAKHSPRVLCVENGPKLSMILQFMEINHQKNVVSREHIEKEEKKEQELDAFVEGLRNVEDVSLSFEENVDKVVEETKPDKLTEQKVREAMHE